jgi:hypothetical protein
MDWASSQEVQVRDPVEEELRLIVYFPPWLRTVLRTFFRPKNLIGVKIEPASGDRDRDP